MLRSLCAGAFISALASVAFAGGLPARTVTGEYIEARTADVWTGPCFANGEIEINGKEAVLGWKIDRGEWRGVKLNGLSVVGVIRAEHTLGNISEPVNPARAVLIVDSRANREQRAALEAFARHMAGDLLRDVVKVTEAPIEFAIADGDIHGGAARLTAGSLAAVETRALEDRDRHCGNEMVFYPPLTDKLDHSMPAFAAVQRYEGDGLGVRWDKPDGRTGFLGTFDIAAL